MALKGISGIGDLSSTLNSVEACTELRKDQRNPERLGVLGALVSLLLVEVPAQVVVGQGRLASLAGGGSRLTAVGVVIQSLLVKVGTAARGLRETDRECVSAKEGKSVRELGGLEEDNLV